MYLKFTRVMATLISLCVFAASASAKVWRVNNTPGVSADFNSLTTAIANASVAPGDTLYIEPSATVYSTATLTKRLVLIGAGYFLSGANANTGLQVTPYGTSVSQINCPIASSGSQIIGIDCYIGLGGDTDDLTISRSNVIIFATSEPTAPNPSVRNIRVNKCYLDFRMNSYTLENPRITNCIVTGTFHMGTTTNGLVRNNTFRNVTPNMINSYVSNNIFSSAAGSTSLTNCTIKYNIATTNILPADPALHNVNNIPAANIFLSTGSPDGQYRLLQSGTNPAVNGGEPINGITPDCGAFGTADPYRLSGIPAIPSIYTLTVPTSVPASAISMDITISTRANN